MEKVERFEPITEDIFKQILDCFTPTARMIAGLNEVDLRRGAGVLSKDSKCLWTKDGHRVTVAMGQGGSFSAAKSKDPDPQAPEI